MTFEESAMLQQRYEAGLASYTYLRGTSEGQQPAPVARAARDAT